MVVVFREKLPYYVCGFFRRGGTRLGSFHYDREMKDFFALGEQSARCWAARQVGIEYTALFGPPDSQNSRCGVYEHTKQYSPIQKTRLTTPRATLTSGGSPSTAVLSEEPGVAVSYDVNINNRSETLTWRLDSLLRLVRSPVKRFIATAPSARLFGLERQTFQYTEPEICRLLEGSSGVRLSPTTTAIVIMLRDLGMQPPLKTNCG